MKLSELKNLVKEILKENSITGSEANFDCGCGEQTGSKLAFKRKNDIHEDEENLTIIKVTSSSKSSGMVRGAIGNYNNVQISNGKTYNVSDDTLMEMYKDIIDFDTFHPTPENWNSLLKGKKWDSVDYNLDESIKNRWQKLANIKK